MASIGVSPLAPVLLPRRGSPTDLRPQCTLVPSSLHFWHSIHTWHHIRCFMQSSHKYYRWSVISDRRSDKHHPPLPTSTPPLPAHANAVPSPNTSQHVTLLNLFNLTNRPPSGMLGWQTVWLALALVLTLVQNQSKSRAKQQIRVPTCE